MRLIGVLKLKYIGISYRDIKESQHGEFSNTSVNLFSPNSIPVIDKCCVVLFQSAKKSIKILKNKPDKQFYFFKV